MNDIKVFLWSFGGDFSYEIDLINLVQEEASCNYCEFSHIKHHQYDIRIIKYNTGRIQKIPMNNPIYKCC